LTPIIEGNQSAIFEYSQFCKRAPRFLMPLILEIRKTKHLDLERKSPPPPYIEF